MDGSGLQAKTTFINFKRIYILCRVKSCSEVELLNL